MVLFLFVTWEQRKLREVFDYERPDTYIVKSDKYSDTYSTPVLTANKGFILGYTNEMQVCNKECIIFDDFTLDSKYVTFPFMVKSSALKILTAKIGYFLPFAYQLLQATNIEILGHARHYISVVQPTKVLIPSNDEQIRIGKCIQQIDNLITLHQREHSVKKSTKLSKKHLGDKVLFANAWEQRKLGDTIDFYSGLTYSPSDIVKDDGVFVLRSCNVQEGEIVDDDNVYVRAGAVNSDNVSVDDIIVVVRNGSRSLIGKHAKIKKNMPKTVIGAFMTGLRYKNSAYLNAVLNTSIFAREIEKDLGATINQITTGAFRKMVFPFPKQPEQSLIGNFFEQLDNLITLHQRQLEKLKNIKSALLEKMFV